ncbi:MAG: Asp23/Gls24 family envelope stress response protein [Chloroflexota bacterium]|nr:Asp23/Gls24 family envelope stress response protein [Chloroflexota bacterium]
MDTKRGNGAMVLHVDERFHEEEMVDKIKELYEGGEYMVLGCTDIDDEVIGAVAATAAREIEGVADIGTSSISRTIAERLGRAEKHARGTDVEAGRREAIVNLTIKVIYGFNIPQLIVDVRKRVGARLLEICGLIAKEINVHVVGIEFPSKMPGRVQ